MAAYVLGVTPTGIDDAYIFFVYAENFAAGEGFVYNPGGERVEGFTSLLWVILLAALKITGIWGPAAWFVICAALAALGLTSLTLALTRILKKENVPIFPVLCFGAVWMAVLPGWFLWNVAAFMDVVLWGALLSLFAGLFIRMAMSDESPSGIPVAVLCVLMLLTRPEAIVWVPFLLFCCWTLACAKCFQVKSLILLPMFVSFVTMTGLTVFRELYFGYPLPNTYYVKVSDDVVHNLSQGLSFLGHYLSGGGIAGLVWVFAVCVAFIRLPAIFRLLAGKSESVSDLWLISTFLSGCLTLCMAATIWVGGDHFGGNRPLQPFYPFLFLFVLIFLLDLGKLPELKAELAYSVKWSLIGFLILIIPVRDSWQSLNRIKLQIDFELVHEGGAKASAIYSLVRSAGLTQLPTIGNINAGGLKYYWPGDVFDFMGLNDTEIAHANGVREGKHAHAAFDADIFLRRPPEIVLPYIEGWPSGMTHCERIWTPGTFYWDVLDGIQGRQEFKDLYTYVNAPTDWGKLCMYVRTDYLAKLVSSDDLGLVIFDEH